MKKITLVSIVAWFLLFNLPFTVYAGVSATQSFKVSVTLPAVIGLNVPGDNLAIQKFGATSEENIIKEETSREGQPIILETIVLK